MKDWTFMKDWSLKASVPTGLSLPCRTDIHEGLDFVFMQGAPASWAVPHECRYVARPAATRGAESRPFRGGRLRDAPCTPTVIRSRG
jgi:hypothetical protein